MKYTDEELISEIKEVMANTNKSISKEEITTWLNHIKSINHVNSPIVNMITKRLDIKNKNAAIN